MSQLGVYLLGSPHIECNNQLIKVDRRKSLALFAYLAVTGGNHRRDLLVDLLWPDCNQRRGRTNLRRTLYALRQSLNGEWLYVDRNEIGLNPDTDIWLDVDQFRKHLTECGEHSDLVPHSCPDCIAPLTVAVGLYRGDFLSGFGVKDSLNFDEWQSQVADDLKRAFASALAKLVACYRDLGNFDMAINFAKRWSDVDPLNEVVHCQLMQLYDLAGQRSAVFQQYQICVKTLQNELGIPPQSSTTMLYESIKKGQQAALQDSIEPGQVSRLEPKLPIATSTLQAASDEHGSKNTFVAREAELEKLNRFLDMALDGRGLPVFVTGSAGQGKTVLMQEFALRAQKRIPDLLVASGKCNAQTGIGDPYHPFREILGVLTSDIDALWAADTITQEHARRLWNAFPRVLETLLDQSPDLVETLIPGVPLTRRAAACFTGTMPHDSAWLPRLEKMVHLKTEAPHDPNLQQTALFDQYTRLMGTLAQEWPLLLILDDLHWADIGSISLLFHLGRHLTGRRILILGAFRPDDLRIGKDEKRHSLEAVLNEFRCIYGEIDIDLARAESRRFLDAYIDSEPNQLDNRFRETLYQRTKGHPLFTIEFLRGMQERKALTLDEDGFWIPGEKLDWEILPGRIEAVIAERISRLDMRLYEILQIASVEGEVFTAEVLANLTSTNEREIVKCLSSQLEREHRLVRAQEIQRLGSQRMSRYRFRHILFQNYLYHSLDPVERAYLHEAVGGALEELYNDETQEIALTLAHHFQNAGIEEKAITYLFQAGEQARGRSANEAAIVHFREGLALIKQLPHTPERDQQALEFIIALGVPLVLTKGHVDPEVETVYLEARKLCERVGDDSQYFQILLGLRRFYLHRGELTRTHELGKQFIALAERMQDPAFLSRAYMMHAETLLHLGAFAKTLETSKHGLSLYSLEHSISYTNLFGNDTGIGCRIFEAHALWYLGYPDQARDRAQEALELAYQVSHPFTLVFALYFAASIFHHCRDAETVYSYTESLQKISQTRGFLLYQAWGTILRGWAVATQGDIKAGIKQMQEGMAAWKSIGAEPISPIFRLYQVEVYRQVGRISEGLALLDKALATVEKTNERTCEAELIRLQGELLLKNGGSADEAEACFLRALQIAREQNAKGWELRVANSLCRLEQRDGRVGTAHQTLREIYEWFGEGFDTPDLVMAGKLLSHMVQSNI